MRKPERLAGVDLIPPRSAPSMPDNTMAALAWCRNNRATVKFGDDDVEVSVFGGRYGLGDTLVMAVRDCIRVLA